MTEAELNAQLAYERYKDAFDHDALIQGSWHRHENGGRELACALGALTPDINSPNDCPASVMPKWLAQQVVWFFDGQDFADAKDWGLRFYAEIKRLNGKVPFSVVHDWHANIVAPLAIEVAKKRKRKPDLHRALQTMHEAALAGKKFSADEWRPVLKDAFFDANANANANAYANAYAKRQSVKWLADGMLECLKRVHA